MPTVPDTVLHPLSVRRLEVVAIEELSVSMKRVRLGGGELASLVTLGPTDHIKLVVPGPGYPELEMPELVDGRVVWPSGARPPMRDYTIRRHYEARNEMDVDIAIHGEGHVSTWAESAHVGAVVGSGGPRGSHPMPIADHYALVGDLSSLPAIARWVEELPAGVTAQVLVAAGSADDQIELSSLASISVHWIHGEGRVPADHLSRGLDLLDLARPDIYVWGAGEVEAMKSVRQRLRDEFSLTKDQFSVGGYWRRDEPGYDHHQPLD